MNRNQAAELLPIIKAFAEGKDIEYRSKGFNEDWKKVTQIPELSFKSFEYRIKPESKYRPFKDAEECWQEMQKHQPVGWVKAIPDKEYNAKYCPNNEYDTIYYQVQKVAPGYIKYDDIDDYCEIGEQDKSYKDVFKAITFADGLPFGVKVEE